MARSEYKAFYQRRERMQPLDCSRFWIGENAEDDGFSAVRVTPLVLHSPRNSARDVPRGYALAIVLGRVVVQGLRFTSPHAEVDAISTMEMPQLWPGQETLQWPGGTPCTNESFLGFADGKMLRVVDAQGALLPWRQAAHMPVSALAGDQVEVPAMCRKHVVSYPATLHREAMRGRFYAFLRTCGCQVTYLLHTDWDRSRFRAHGDDALGI